MRRAILLAFVVLATGCSKAAPSAAPDPAGPLGVAPRPGDGPKPPQAATAAAIQPLAQKKFGGPITEKESTPLMSLVRDPARFADKTVRTEGLVTAVCQAAGCWMQIADDTGLVHVKMAGHAFLVPRNASGHRAVVQGKLLSQPGDSCADHDGCRENAEAETGRVAKLEMDATGVELVD